MLGTLLVLPFLRIQYYHFSYDISVSFFKYVCVCVHACKSVYIPVVKSRPQQKKHLPTFLLLHAQTAQKTPL
jgi:hypothetical protein